jgi:hypothetical protein
MPFYQSHGGMLYNRYYTASIYEYTLRDNIYYVYGKLSEHCDCRYLFPLSKFLSLPKPLVPASLDLHILPYASYESRDMMSKLPNVLLSLL